MTGNESKQNETKSEKHFVSIYLKPSFVVFRLVICTKSKIEEVEFQIEQIGLKDEAEGIFPPKHNPREHLVFGVFNIYTMCILH